MKIDVVYVTYNSEKWIADCFAAWKQVRCAEEVNIIVVDNASTDGTIECLERAESVKVVNSFRIIRLSENVGFGEANNIGFQQGVGELVCFFNIDTELHETSLEELLAYVQRSEDDYGVWELRQMPYEHPKYYDPVTLETSWCSGAAFAVRREVFEAVGGFDKDFFMYAEDVDLSWRIRTLGWRIMYCPRARILHKTYAEAGEVKPVQYSYSIRNNILLRYRYGTLRDILNGYILFLKLILSNGLGVKFNFQVTKTVWSHLSLCKKFRTSGVSRKVAYFDGLNYADMRYGAFCPSGETAEPVRVLVFLVENGAEDGEAVEKCLKNQTHPPCAVKRVAHISNIPAELVQGQVEEPCWFSILQESDRLFADHYELLTGLIRDGSSVTATVNHEGEVQEGLCCYLMHPSFADKNRELFLKNNQQEIAAECRAEAVFGEKQTVYFPFS